MLQHRERLWCSFSFALCKSVYPFYWLKPNFLWREWQWLFTLRSCTQNDFVYIHDRRVPNMILSIYTMVGYIMYVVYIHDRFVLLNLGQQVRKFFGVFFRVFFYKLIQYVPRIFFKYIINFINVKEFKLPSFRIVKHLTLSVLHWFFIQTTSELSCFGLLAKNIHFRFKHIYLLNGLDYSDDFYTLWYRYVKEQTDKKKNEHAKNVRYHGYHLCVKNTNNI